MSSILLFTKDTETQLELERLTKNASLRLRSVDTIQGFDQWLSMNPYDAIFIDSSLDGIDGVELLEKAWKLHPLAIGAIFNRTSELQSEWAARLSGARVVSPPLFVQKFEKLISSIRPEKNTTEQTAVLVVEDLDAPRDIICALIESLGYPEVYGVGSAEEALQALRKEPRKFFCILTDINMPEKSGVFLTKEVRKDPLIDHLPIIAITSFPTDEHLIECIKAGATGFLAKPPKKNILRKELEKAKRIILSNESPALCKPEDIQLLESELQRYLDNQ